MPPSKNNAILQAAQHHAFAHLVRTEGWRLYMARLLTTLWAMDRNKGSSELTDHGRSKLMGRREQILMDITYVYKEAGEDNPLEFEHKAILARLTTLQHTAMPTANGQKDEDEVVIPRRSSRHYAGGVE